MVNLTPAVTHLFTLMFQQVEVALVTGVSAQGVMVDQVEAQVILPHLVKEPQGREIMVEEVLPEQTTLPVAGVERRGQEYLTLQDQETAGLVGQVYPPQFLVPHSFTAVAGVEGTIPLSVSVGQVDQV